LLIRTFLSCPIPGHGTNAIIEGSPEWSSDGKAIVVDGCKCQCGCQVISGAPECAIG
ncbi:PAAR domain-containing protein, partial [Klebsiella pneumoniae]|uniref:PAAR domain-containing protein n=1 Tax=Klebsiella pneumoniae TaxID=573 RepID=UPI001863F6D1